MIRRAALLGLLLLPLAAACRSAAERPDPRALVDADYPGPLRPATALGREVLWRQHVTAEWGDGGRRGFDAALQVHGGVLTLLGLAPTGGAGFVIRHAGGAVELENRTGEELPFPPRFVLLDVQRVFFPWVAAPGERLADGAHVAELDGERVTEVWRDGRLVERRFERLDGRPAGTIVVRYAPGGAFAVAPEAVLENGWFGYRLTVRTLAETPLPPASEAP